MLPSVSNGSSAFLPSYALGSVSKTTTSILSMVLLLFVLPSLPSSASVSLVQCNRQLVSPSKRSDSRTTESQSFREFAKLVKTRVGFLRGKCSSQEALQRYGARFCPLSAPSSAEEVLYARVARQRLQIDLDAQSRSRGYRQGAVGIQLPPSGSDVIDKWRPG